MRYFSRPGRVALLVAIGLFTYGLGGLVYWLVRRKHRVCPNCGLGWEHATRRLHVGSGDDRRERAFQWDESLPPGGAVRRVLGVAALLAAGFLLSLGVVELNLTLIAAGGGTGAAGSVTFWWGWRALQSRRDALMTRLQRQVLLLASERGGTLTVTEVAAQLDLSLEGAEKVLISMDDGFRVRSEITREGLLLYEFPEILHRARLSGGEPELG